MSKHPKGTRLRRVRPLLGLAVLVGASIVLFAPQAASSSPRQQNASPRTGVHGLATADGAVIQNGTVMLGVNASGELNYDCVSAQDAVCPDPSAEDHSPAVGV